MANEIFLIRHGETAWSLSGQHTSRTDLPLTEEGRRRAAALKKKLSGREFALVLSSPMRRAAETSQPRRLSSRRWIPISTNGTTAPTKGSPPARSTRPRRSGPSGTALRRAANRRSRSGARADLVIQRALGEFGEGDVAIFGHGHMLRVLAARWLELAPTDGRLFALDTGTLSVMGWEHTVHVIRIWNEGS